jgi:hypothetical protein
MAVHVYSLQLMLDDSMTPELDAEVLPGLVVDVMVVLVVVVPGDEELYIEPEDVPLYGLVSEKLLAVELVVPTDVRLVGVVVHQYSVQVYGVLVVVVMTVTVDDEPDEDPLNGIVSEKLLAEELLLMPTDDGLDVVVAVHQYSVQVYGVVPALVVVVAGDDEL